MEKPQSMSIKDWLIRNISTKQSIPERTIELVVNHQFEGAHKALVNCYTLEFSGWAKFYFNKKKAVKKLEQQKEMEAAYRKQSLDASLTPQKRHLAGLKLISVINNIELIKAKLLNEEITSG